MQYPTQHISSGVSQFPITEEISPQQSFIFTNAGLELTYIHSPANVQGYTEDEGSLNYNFHERKDHQNFIELNFCLRRKKYCASNAEACSNCKLNKPSLCLEPTESINEISLKYSPPFFHEFSNDTNPSLTHGEQVLSFSHATSFTAALPLCGKLRNLLDGLFTHSYNGIMQEIFIRSHALQLLLHSISCLTDEVNEPVFTCKFLENQAGREKILAARDILLQHLCEPITIKLLSRKVMLNECYLKKGFKEIYGSTIFEFYQAKRMEYAKDLLYKKGLSVTDVAELLGYSSISHFSTAFKKFTGIKPCELLLP